MITTESILNLYKDEDEDFECNELNLKKAVLKYESDFDINLY